MALLNKQVFKQGDRIVSFNGTENPTLGRDQRRCVAFARSALAGRRQSKRCGSSADHHAHVRTEDGETAGFWISFLTTVDYRWWSADVAPGSPAADAGLKEGDRFISIGGEDVRSSAQVTEYIRRSRCATNSDHCRARWSEQCNSRTDERRIDGRLGFGVTEQYPLHAATIRIGCEVCVRLKHSDPSFDGKALGQVFTGQRSVRNTLSGPIGIYQAAQKSVERLGWDGVFGMLGFLSLNLGIFNLLPIPVLDGGAIFLLLIEGLLALVGLSISAAVRDRIQQVGFVMVLLLMVFVITNDAGEDVWR